MPVLVSVRGDEVGAIGGAVDRDFAPGATADGTDFFTFGGAEAGWLTFFADRAKHTKLLKQENSSAEYTARQQKTKTNAHGSDHDNLFLEASGSEDQKNGADEN